MILVLLSFHRIDCIDTSWFKRRCFCSVLKHTCILDVFINDFWKIKTAINAKTTFFKRISILLQISHKRPTRILHWKGELIFICIKSKKEGRLPFNVNDFFLPSSKFCFIMMNSSCWYWNEVITVQSLFWEVDQPIRTKNRLHRCNWLIRVDIYLRCQTKMLTPRSYLNKSFIIVWIWLSV